jgi:hypothetical protein
LGAGQFCLHHRGVSNTLNPYLKSWAIMYENNFLVSPAPTFSGQC